MCPARTRTRARVRKVAGAVAPALGSSLLTGPPSIHFSIHGTSVNSFSHSRDLIALGGESWPLCRLAPASALGSSLLTGPPSIHFSIHGTSVNSFSHSRDLIALGGESWPLCRLAPASGSCLWLLASNPGRFLVWLQLLVPASGSSLWIQLNNEIIVT